MIIASMTGAHFTAFSAVLSGVKEIREVIQEANEEWKYRKKGTILLVDEIHRFNKAQQDAFLPHVEKGTIILIGSTTENPSFEVISPLLSRTKVFTLNRLTEKEIEGILRRGLEDKERGLGKYPTVAEPEIFQGICLVANGDARVGLNTLEMVVLTTPPDPKGVRQIKEKDLEEVLQKKSFIYDKSGEEHYNLISALHKSLRGRRRPRRLEPGPVAARGRSASRCCSPATWPCGLAPRPPPPAAPRRPTRTSGPRSRTSGSSA